VAAVINGGSNEDGGSNKNKFTDINQAGERAWNASFHVAIDAIRLIVLISFCCRGHRLHTSPRGDSDGVSAQAHRFVEVVTQSRRASSRQEALDNLKQHRILNVQSHIWTMVVIRPGAD
jgi:hypothetical protein